MSESIWVSQEMLEAGDPRVMLAAIIERVTGVRVEVAEELVGDSPGYRIRLSPFVEAEVDR